MHAVRRDVRRVSADGYDQTGVPFFAAIARGLVDRLARSPASGRSTSAPGAVPRRSRSPRRSGPAAGSTRSTWRRAWSADQRRGHRARSRHGARRPRRRGRPALPASAVRRGRVVAGDLLPPAARGRADALARPARRGRAPGWRPSAVDAAPGRRSRTSRRVDRDTGRPAATSMPATGPTRASRPLRDAGAADVRTDALRSRCPSTTSSSGARGRSARRCAGSGRSPEDGARSSAGSAACSSRPRRRRPQPPARRVRYTFGRRPDCATTPAWHADPPS